MFHHSLFDFKDLDCNLETQNLSGRKGERGQRARGSGGQDEVVVQKTKWMP
jgi:hypothetical protein